MSQQKTFNFPTLIKNLPQKKYFRVFLFLIIGVTVGLTLFLLIYGRYSVYFTHVNWLYKFGGDSFQHQLGWEWFRQEPWSFPLGRIESYGYPFGTYMAYMDSIPLFAIPFKLLSPWLEQRFQYFGLWELASVICQTLASMLIIGEFTTSYPKKILGASLLVLSPPMIHRAFTHSSLSAHWILLLAIWLVIREYRYRSWRFAWPLLFAFAVMIHLYFVALLIPLWILALYFRFPKENKKWFLLIDLLSVIAVVLILSYSIGLFSLNMNGLQSRDYGFHSWNLNGFLNPQGTSVFLDGLAHGTDGQYEGYSYLGLGNLILLPIALIFFLQKDYSNAKLKFIIPFAIISIPYILFAASNKAYLNSIQIWNVELSNKLIEFFSIFRSSGRFIWPVFYFIVLFGLIGALRNIKHPEAFLALVVLLQFIDIQPLYISKKLTSFVRYESPLMSEFWDAATSNEHIILIPADDSALGIYQPIASYARQNEMTMNWGYFARGNRDAIKAYAESIVNELETGNIDSNTLYIFHENAGKETAKNTLSPYLILCEIDNFVVGFSSKNSLTNNYDINNINCQAP